MQPNESWLPAKVTHSGKQSDQLKSQLDRICLAATIMSHSKRNIFTSKVNPLHNVILPLNYHKKYRLKNYNMKAEWTLEGNTEETDRWKRSEGSSETGRQRMTDGREGTLNT